MTKSHRTNSRGQRAGLSLLEVVISTLLVGLVLISALQCLAASIRGNFFTADSARANHLARELMTEIRNTDYQDDSSPVFGPEPGEAGANRLNFDDVDDFNSWVATPPAAPDGTAIANSTGWQREVVVELVATGDPVATAGADSGFKRITVTVRLNGQVVSQRVGLRSSKVEIP